jgi:thiamine phosphate synthase YjbQ (UPF0047 family)
MMASSICKVRCVIELNLGQNLVFVVHAASAVFCEEQDEWRVGAGSE